MSKELETILEDALLIADEVLAKSTVISESETTELDNIELNEDENLSEMDLANVTPVATPASSDDTVEESVKKKKKKGKTPLNQVTGENGKPEEDSELDAKQGDETAELDESSDVVEEATIDKVAEYNESMDTIISEFEAETSEESTSSIVSEGTEDEVDLADVEEASDSDVSESSKSKKKKAKILCEKCNKTEVSESGQKCESCSPKGSNKSKALNEDDQDSLENKDDKVSESIDDLVSEQFPIEEDEGTKEDEELNEALVLGSSQSVVAQSKEAKTCSKCNSHVKFLVTENETYVRPLFIKKAKLPLSKRYKKMCPNCKHTEVIKKEDLGNLNKPLEENTFFIEDGSTESLELQREFDEIETSLNESIDDLVSDMYEEKGEIDMLVEDLLEAAEAGTWLSGNDVEELDEVMENSTSNTGDAESKDVILNSKTNKSSELSNKHHPIKGDPLAGSPSDEDGDLNNDGKVELIRS